MNHNEHLSHEKEQQKFEEFLKKKKLKQSEKRNAILDIFWTQHDHFTAEELYSLVRESSPRIGFTTVYRTLKLLCESGLCREVKFNDGLTRYEHHYNHPHHDHLICSKCGRVEEMYHEALEGQIEQIYKNFQFKPQHHKVELYGVCPQCL